ncbi:MAG: sodium-dependent bicarbonate transport family permease [Alphaproteobacteria bacterium PRO2]|nr:sodium-dependent bicarbonate transport family permease [Alphaproteobacteria bacterium PRO2]
MGFLELIEQNLLTPPILFFALGVLAGIIKSDLEVPKSISRYLSLYLMMAIGFKGGVALANTPDINGEIVYTALAGVVVGLLQPFAGYWLLRKTTLLDTPTAAAVAAHYGSISMVTFATAAAFLDAHEIIYAGYIVAVLALMEAPAIVSGLFIAHRAAPKLPDHSAEEKKLLTRNIFTNGAILLLLGSFVIGWATGQSGMDKVGAFLVDPFQGVLCLFLLDMGLLVARNLHNVKGFSWQLLAFAFYMPLLGAIAGMSLSYLIGLDIGTGTLFTTLCAGASYIAVPAAMRLALPEANAAVYLPMSLAVTFPFNIMLGIPLYYYAAERLL